MYEEPKTIEEAFLENERRRVIAKQKESARQREQLLKEEQLKKDREEQDCKSKEVMDKYYDTLYKMNLAETYFNWCLSEINNNEAVQNRILESIASSGSDTVVLSDYWSASGFNMIEHPYSKTMWKEHRISYHSDLVRNDFWMRGKTFRQDIEATVFKGYEVVARPVRILFIFKSYLITFQKKATSRWPW